MIQHNSISSYDMIFLCYYNHIKWHNNDMTSFYSVIQFSMLFIKWWYCVILYLIIWYDTIYFHLLQYNTRHTISYHMSYNAIPYTIRCCIIWFYRLSYCKWGWYVIWYNVLMHHIVYYDKYYIMWYIYNLLAAEL